MKRILPNSKIVNREIKQSQINKNNDVDIEYNIKRIKKERRYTFYLVIFFIVLILSIFYLVISKVQNRIENNKVNTKNLSIIYQSDINGIKDYINIRNSKDKEYIYFTIHNNSNKTIKYIVYLVDDKDLISLEGCNTNIIDYSKLMIKLNQNKEINLLSTKDKNKYIIDENTITKKTAKEVRIKIYPNKDIKENYHYHGRIMVEENNKDK